MVEHDRVKCIRFQRFFIKWKWINFNEKKGGEKGKGQREREREGGPGISHFIKDIDYNGVILGGALGVMVIVIGNGHSDTSSNPGPD